MSLKAFLGDLPVHALPVCLDLENMPDKNKIIGSPLSSYT
jgi:hypothetical protein